MAKKKETKMTDIFSGKHLQVWKDEDFVFVSFPWAIVNFPMDEWEDIKEDLVNLADVLVEEE